MLRGLSKGESLEILEGWRKAIEAGDLYGFGLSKMLYLEAPPDRLYDESFKLKALFDNNPALWGQRVMGLEIRSPERIQEIGGGRLVVFSGGEKYSPIYHQIRGQLMEMGLRENRDFVAAQDFWTLWQFYGQGKIFNSRHFTWMVTDRCNLKCEFCNIQIYKRENTRDIPLEELESDISRFFELADSLNSFSILGGEPLLYKELPALLDLLSARWRSKCSQVNIFTNGSLVPSGDILKKCRELRVNFFIGDYRGSGLAGYEEKFQRLTAALSAKGICFTTAGDEPWISKDLSPEQVEKLSLMDEAAHRRHFAACTAICPSFKNNIYHSCRRWNDRHPEADQGIDGTDLGGLNKANESDRLKILMTFLDYHDAPMLQGCADCTGHGQELFPFPAILIPRGNQINHEHY